MSFPWGQDMERGTRMGFIGRYAFTLAATGVAVAGAADRAEALSFGADFAAFYTAGNIGTPPGFAGSLGGVAFAPGDAGTLVLGDQANTSAAAIYSIGVTRTGGTITGFTGTRTLVSPAAGPGRSGGIDGGLAYGPGGVLFYTAYSSNGIGQIKPGSAAPDRIDSLAGEVSSSVGALQFVPAGFAGAGSMKVASFNSGDWYDVTLTPDGSGTFDLDFDFVLTLPGGPEGIVYVSAGNPGFATDSVLISEYSGGAVGAYEIDGNGDPILGTRRTFLSDLSGTEGAALDPLTGDFIFSTYGAGNDVVW